MTEKGLTGEDADAIVGMIDAVYGVVLDQDRFDELIALSATNLEDDARKARFAALQASMEAHLHRAEDMLSRFPPEEGDDGDERPAFRVSRAGRILDANTQATALLGIRPGLTIDDLDLSADASASLRAFAAGTGSHTPILRLTRRDTGKPYIVLIDWSPAEGAERHLLARGADAVWSDGAAEAMMALFGLSMSEAEVLGLLLSGFSPSEVAAKRDRALDTVRQQIRSMLSKTQSPGTAGLIHMARAVAQSVKRQPGAGAATARFRRGRHRLPDARVVDYLRQGREAGEAVVFLHGCLCGNRFPRAAAEYLHRNGIDLVSPARPSHGRSSGRPDLLDRPDGYAEDLISLVDDLGIGRFHLLAFDIGTIFALTCARRLAGRVTGITCVSAQPPMRGLHDWASAPAQQRIFALMPGFSLPLLRFLAKAGDRRLKRDGMAGFAKTVFGGAPADLRACENPDLLRLFWEGHLFHVETGSDGFINDCRLVAARWDNRFAAPDVPVHFVHGEENVSVAPGRVFAFADRIGAQVTLVPGAGHSLVFSHWPAVLDIVRRSMTGR